MLVWGRYYNSPVRFTNRVRGDLWGGSWHLFSIIGDVISCKDGCKLLTVILLSC